MEVTEVVHGIHGPVYTTTEQEYITMSLDAVWDNGSHVPKLRNTLVAMIANRLGVALPEAVAAEIKCEVKDEATGSEVKVEEEEYMVLTGKEPKKPYQPRFLDD